MNQVKKIGIITFHRSQNYGATFQVFALQKTLDNLGINNYVIDYRNKKMEKVFKLQRNLLKAVINYLCCAPLSYRKKSIFDRFFQENIKMTKTYHSGNIKGCKELQDFTGFITGSDQVFAHIFTDFDKNYFLDFAGEEQKRYSYAASFGSCSIPGRYRPEYRRLLDRFHRISVREESGAALVRELSNQDAEVHIDPTLLLSRQEWHKISRTCRRKRYLFVYVMQEPNYLLECAQRLAEQHQLDIIYVGEKQFLAGKPYSSDQRFHYVPALPPYEFLGYLEQADYVLTNSFHGTVFSILFQKKFLVEPQAKMDLNTRVINLLDTLQITGRSIHGNDCPDIEQIPDWNSVEMRLEELRKEAMQYLGEVMEC